MKTSRCREENQQTQPTFDAGSGNRTRATLVGGECLLKALHYGELMDEIQLIAANIKPVNCFDQFCQAKTQPSSCLISSVKLYRTCGAQSNSRDIPFSHYDSIHLFSLSPHLQFSLHQRKTVKKLYPIRFHINTHIRM